MNSRRKSPAPDSYPTAGTDGFLALIESRFAHEGAVFRLPSGRLCVADPEAAKSIMANAGSRYREHSDFFHTKSGTFGPRSAQITIGQHARTLLDLHVAARAGSLTDLVDRALAPASEWPDAGSRLILDHMRDALLSPDARPAAHAILDQVIARAVLAGARQDHSTLSRAAFRRRVIRELTTEIASRRRAANGDRSVPEKDVVDVVLNAAPTDARVDQLIEVFLSFVFAVVGATGFVLGWSLYLSCRAGDAPDVPPGWIVREALRLWPVAWMFGRTPIREHAVAGTAVEPGNELLVCSYLVHRHPAHWPEPDVFRPERWSGIPDRRAYLPFGWGPHACVGASLVSRLVEDVVRIVHDDYRVAISGGSPPRPHVGPMLAPPRFQLRLSPRTAASKQGR